MVKWSAVILSVAKLIEFFSGLFVVESVKRQQLCKTVDCAVLSPRQQS